MKFSSQSSSFNYNDISTYYNMWKSFNKKNEDGLTSRSIMYWAKIDNFENYEKIREKTVSYFIDKNIILLKKAHFQLLLQIGLVAK